MDGRKRETWQKERHCRRERKRGNHSERVRALHLIPLSGRVCLGSVISETSAPRESRVRHVYISIRTYTRECSTCYYVRIGCAAVDGAYRHARTLARASCAYATERCVHTRRIVQTSVIDLFREEAGISGLREGLGEKREVP